MPAKARTAPRLGGSKRGAPSLSAEARAAQSVTMSASHLARRPLDALNQLNRQIAESSLIDYAELMWPVIEPGRAMARGWAVEAMCEHLEAVTRGDIRKLLMNVPPGMMKSLLTQVFWPTWEWGPKNLPHTRYVGAAYSQDLTVRDNRRARQLIESDLYQQLWGSRFAISADQDAKVRYDNDKRGFRIATSVGGLSTGERGDRFIIDDPHNVKTAESEARLDEVAQWITEVVPARVNDLEDSAFVVIMQRVHERDASGVLLSADLGYTHLELPMEFEPGRRCGTAVRSQYHLPGETTFTDPRTTEGELLFPERFTRKGVDDLKKTLSSWGGESAVAGQLQQRPAPRGGGMFQVEARKESNELFVDSVPAGARRVRGWDIAGSKRKKSPFTASALLCEYRGMYYIADVTRERKEIEAAEQHIVETVEADGRSVRQSLPQDPGSAGKSQKRHLGAALTGHDFTITPESGSKEDRAVGIAAQFNNGNVKVVRGPWNAPFLAELAMFPRSQYKDQVDALSRAYAEMLMRPKRSVPAGPREVRPGAEDPEHGGYE